MTHSSAILTKLEACITHSSAILTKPKACITYSSAILTKPKAYATHYSALSIKLYPLLILTGTFLILTGKQSKKIGVGRVKVNYDTNLFNFVREIVTFHMRKGWFWWTKKRISIGEKDDFDAIKCGFWFDEMRIFIG